MISDPSSRNIPRNNWEHGLWNLYTKVYSSIIHRSPKVGTTQMSISRWTDKQNVLCSQIHIQRIIFCLIFLIIKKRTLNILQHGWTLKTGVKCFTHFNSWGFPGSSTGKEYACNAGNLGSIPGLGRSPGEGNGNSLQYSCLENSRDRGAWRAAKGRAWLSNKHFHVHISFPLSFLQLFLRVEIWILVLKLSLL